MPTHSFTNDDFCTKCALPNALNTPEHCWEFQLISNIHFSRDSKTVCGISNIEVHYTRVPDETVTCEECKRYIKSYIKRANSLNKRSKD